VRYCLGNLASAPAGAGRSGDAKAPATSTVVVEHSKLADADERDARQAYWRHALATLKEELERDA
jgi:hypothetical protein